MERKKRKVKDDDTKIKNEERLTEALGSKPPLECSLDLSNETFNELFPTINNWAQFDDEEPQSFSDFKTMERYEITSKRKVIYLLPIGDWPEDAPSTDSFSDFLSHYFSLSCKVLSPVSIVVEDKKLNILADSYLYPIKTKISKDFPGMRRLHTLETMRVLKDFLPKDGYCIFGITYEDIYEHYSSKDKTDQVILGRGSGDRVGVISLRRFDPLLEAKQKKKVKCSAEEQKAWFLEACKTTVHEGIARKVETLIVAVSHTFGIDHCNYFSCIMNACVSPEGETTQDSMWFCPIDLRKIQYAIGFDFGTHFDKLESYFTKQGFEKEAKWLQKFKKHYKSIE